MENSIRAVHHRPARSRDVRHPPTTVDSTGCIITRGFVVPSRATSFDSEARGSTDSTSYMGSAFVEAAPPGFRAFNASAARPGAAFSASSHRTSSSVGNMGFKIRPCRDDQASTSQSMYSRGSYVSSRWDDIDLAETICKPPSRPVYRNSDPFPHWLGRSRKSPSKMRRTKSDQVNLKDSVRRDSKYSSTEHTQEGAAMLKSAQCSPRPDSEEAIESANASDIVSISPSIKDTRVKSKMQAQVDRISYAERRARNDARDKCTKAPEILSQAEPLSLPDNENVFESDDEGDDGHAACSVDDLAEALRLAEIHCSRNLEMAVSKSPSKETPTAMSSSGARVAPSMASIQSSLKVDASAKLTTQGSESDPPMQRDLRPSNSRPRPPKGVLKSRSHSRGASPKSGQRAHFAWNQAMSTHARFLPDDVAVGFAAM